MVSAIAVLVIDAVDPELITGFWCDVLGWVELDRDADVVSIGPAGGPPRIDVVRVPERKAIKNRLHLDLRADGSATREELQRLLDLGASRIDVGQGEVSWVVLADPEGNEFCLLARTVSEVAGTLG